MQTKHKFNHSLFIFGLMVLLFATVCLRVTAAPGDLDTTFGSGGKVVTPVTPLDEFASRVRIQSDGKIVTLGYVANAQSTITDSFIVRHNANGTVDTSFGTNGSVLVSSATDEYFNDFVILPDGRFLIAGFKYNSTGGLNFAVFRYLANGTRDASFGTNGVITTPVGSDAQATRIALQPDGKFVVAGFTRTSSGAVDKVAIARYNSGGTLDTTFGTNGIAITSVGNNILNVREVLVQTDGKLLVAGHANFAGNINIFVLRYNAGGTLDNSFGASGTVQTDIDNQLNVVGGMALQADGKIVVNSSNYNSTGNTILSSAIVRYNVDGTLDNTFGTGGIVRITEPSQNSAIAAALAIQQNGKIITAGVRNGIYAVARYNSNGTIDSSFGTNGIVTSPLGNNPGFDRIFSIALQTDGKIVAAGGVNNASFFYDVGLARYFGDATTVAPRAALYDFDGDQRADLAVYRPSSGTWFIRNAQAGYSATQFGLSTDKIVPADYDGDGKTDIAVYRSGTWYLQRSQTGYTSVQFGLPDDTPVPADYDADGKADIAVYRPSNGTWYILNQTTGQYTSQQWGVSTDKPVVADYDGDGRADYAVYRPSNGTWYLLRSRDGFASVQWGESTDKPVVGDYDGDGKADEAVYRPSNGTWYLLRSRDGFTSAQFGEPTDLPVPADYDADGKTDVAVYRPSSGTWFLLKSTEGIASVQFGDSTDRPIPNAFVP